MYKLTHTKLYNYVKLQNFFSTLSLKIYFFFVLYKVIKITTSSKVTLALNLNQYKITLLICCMDKKFMHFKSFKLIVFYSIFFHKLKKLKSYALNL